MTDNIMENNNEQKKDSIVIDEDAIRKIYMKQAEDKINKLKKYIGIEKPKTSDAQKKAFKKYYKKNHDKMLEMKRQANKIYYEKYRNRYHCEICDKYYHILDKAEKHFLTKKHQNAIINLSNKLMIKNTEKNEYII